MHNPTIVLTFASVINAIMDLVSRLKTYIESIAMPVTQFADACAIPRPTFSQLLSGRNKKVSNELITKIHDAFPELNVLWLMFGQGDMLVAKNIGVSEPQIAPKSDSLGSQTAGNQPYTSQILHFDETPDFAAENSDTDDEAEIGLSGESPVDIERRNTVNGIGGLQSIALPADSTKKIVNIIVYYSDNSFQAFVPERQS